MIRLAILLALVGLGLRQEESDIVRWIADLAHEEIARREEASKRLMAAGESILPQLQKLIDSGRFSENLLARDRLKLVERTIRETFHDARERPRKLRLVTFEDGEMRLGDVLATIERAGPVTISSDLDPDRRVRVGGKDVPVRAALDDLERQLDVTIEPVKGSRNRHEIKPGRRDRGPQVQGPGASFRVQKTPWIDEDKFEGWVIAAELGDWRCQVMSLDVRDAAGTPLKTESCDVCGPVQTKVLTKVKGDLRIRWRVQVQWTSDYVFTVDDPARRQEFRVGAWNIQYEFLKAKVDGTVKIETRVGEEFELRVKTAKGGAFGTSSSVLHEAWRRVPHSPWCPWVKKESYFSEETLALDWLDANSEGKLKPADVASVEIRFSKPMVETFERELLLKE